MSFIDLTNDSSSSNSSSDCESLQSLVFSPVKPKIEESPVEALKQIIPNVNEDDYHDATARCIPVLARPLQGLNVTQLFTLMLGKIPADRICKRKPTSVTYSSVFIIDLTIVKCIDDLHADDNGVWCHGGKPRRKYVVDRDSDTSEVIKVSPVDDHSDSEKDDIFTLVCMYHHHKATPEFQRRISYVIDNSEQTVQYAVVQYLFDGGKEIPVTLLPHGNAKNTTILYTAEHKRVHSLVSKKFLESQRMLFLCYMKKLVAYYKQTVSVSFLVIVDRCIIISSLLVKLPVVLTPCLN